MARGSGNGNRNNGSSKIRFIMLEADLSDGNLDQVTQAITNALRPLPVVHRVVSLPAQTLGANSIGEQVSEDNTGSDDVESVAEVSAPASPPRSAPKTPRKYPSPKVLSDVDLNSGPMSFEAFVQQKNPTETSKRFLTVAAWFKAYRNTDSITFDHAYTCYKKMGWGTTIKDFGQPLRDLKAQGWGDLKSGVFSINHIGEGIVDKMAAE